MRAGRALAAVVVVVAATGGCSEATAPPASPSAAPVEAPRATSMPTAVPPVRFDAGAASATVRALAGVIGPREATTAAYDRAADLVAGRLRELGYSVREENFDVPAGTSWGVRVPAGGTSNVIATSSAFAPEDPHLLVGAHLDTVPQAPGAEDNASGVAVLLELARLAAAEPGALRLPVVFVAFGAEEPRGPGDGGHHYGSRHHVGELTARQLDALHGMVSLDRVGVGSEVPVCNGGSAGQRVVEELRAAARRARVATRDCGANRSSDHWSFEKAGVVVARLGSTPYAAYHSERDRPDVVSRTQLDRVGQVMWAWLTD
jgi:hypothetical protein